jgi:hypothetical protein
MRVPMRSLSRAFQLQSWKAGDKTSWESQLKVRTQMGQNDYNKVP